MSKTNKNYLHIGILSAMPQEVGVIIENLNEIRCLKYGDLELYSGELNLDKGHSIFVSVAWSGWGKVSAARATTRLLSVTYKCIPVGLIFFTGVAGAVDKKLKQWDIVISEALIQYDMDARPIYDKYVIPALNKSKIFSNKSFLNKVFKNMNKQLLNSELKGFGSIYKGLIGTGDMFISDRNKIEDLRHNIEGIMAVEMEGAAFAQVAIQEKVEWIVIRVISDGGDEEAVDDFNNFLVKYKSKSFDLIKSFLNSIL